MNRRIGGIALIFVALFATSFLVLYHLGNEPLQDYDEATYAEISTEALANNQFMALSFLDHDYFRKPPVLFWLMDVSEALLTDPETAARLPSALSAIFLALVSMGLVWYGTKSRYAAGFAGIVIGTTGALIEPARQARFDVLISMFIMAAVLAALRAFEPVHYTAQNSRRWVDTLVSPNNCFLWFGFFLGLAFLTKGPIAGFAVMGFLAIAFAYRRIDWLWNRYFWGAVAIFFVVVAPWHIYETVKFGTAFWASYLDDQVLDRVGQMLFNGPTNAQYLGYFFSFAAPWAQLFAASVIVLPLVWKKMTIRQQALMLSSIAGVASVLLVSFLSKTKAISYLIPLYPFMAVGIALMAYMLWMHIDKRLRILLALLLIAASIDGLGLTVFNAFHVNPYYSSQVELADQEKIIGEKLLLEQPTTFYVYDTTTLGSIMFYSRLLQPLPFDSKAVIPSGSFVLSQTSDLPSLEASSTQRLTTIYEGSVLSLSETAD